MVINTCIVAQGVERKTVGAYQSPSHMWRLCKEGASGASIPLLIDAQIPVIRDERRYFGIRVYI